MIVEDKRLTETWNKAEVYTFTPSNHDVGGLNALTQESEVKCTEIGREKWIILHSVCQK